MVGDDDETATGQELAALLGVSVQIVRSQADQGFIIRAPTRGRYVQRESVRRYCEHLRQMASGRGDPGSAQSLAKERARLAREQADLANLKARQIRGELVDAGEVEARWKATLTNVRSGMLAVPSRVRGRLPHLTVAEVEAVDREIRDALTELADAS